MRMADGRREARARAAPTDRARAAGGEPRRAASSTARNHRCHGVGPQSRRAPASFALMAGHARAARRARRPTCARAAASLQHAGRQVPGTCGRSRARCAICPRTCRRVALTQSAGRLARLGVERIQRNGEQRHPLGRRRRQLRGPERLLDRLPRAGRRHESTRRAATDRRRRQASDRTCSIRSAPAGSAMASSSVASICWISSLLVVVVRGRPVGERLARPLDDGAGGATGSFVQAHVVQRLRNRRS